MAKFSPVNTRDIARAAGVSQSTVSRALRNDQRITAKTRRKVAETAQRLGYQVNPLVAAFTSQVRSYRRRHEKPALAVLVAEEQMEGSASWVDPARERIAVYEYDCEIYRLQDHEDLQSVGQALRKRGIRGVYVPPVPLGFNLKPLCLDDLVIVTYGFSLDLPVHRVTPFHFQQMKCALEKLRSYGYRRIGFATSPVEDQRVHHFWTAAFLDYLHRSKPADHVPIHEDPEAFDVSLLADWVERYQPEVIISNARYNYDFLQKAGYRVPEDVAYVSLGAERAPSGEVFSGINQQSEKIAAAAIDLIIAELHKNNYGLPETPSVTMIEGIWRDGFSAPHRAG